MDRVESEHEAYISMLEDLQVDTTDSSAATLHHETRLGDGMGALSVNPVEATKDDSQSQISDAEHHGIYVDKDTGEKCFYEEATGKTWHIVPDSDDESIEEDMPQVEGLFTLRPHYKHDEE